MLFRETDAIISMFFHKPIMYIIFYFQNTLPWPTVLCTCLLRIHLCWRVPGSILAPRWSSVCVLCLMPSGVPAAYRFCSFLRPKTRFESVSISFHLYTFLNSVFCPLSSASTKLESIPVSMLGKSPLLVMLYIYGIYFVFLFIFPDTFSIIGSICFWPVFVYASFWFSQLKLYLLFLFPIWGGGVYIYAP